MQSTGLRSQTSANQDFYRGNCLKVVQSRVWFQKRFRKNIHCKKIEHFKQKNSLEEFEKMERIKKRGNYKNSQKLSIYMIFARDSLR